MSPLDEVLSYRFQAFRGCPGRFEFGKGFGDEPGGVAAGGFDSEDGGPGGLVAGEVFARSLAQLLGVLGYVEYVVDDLEGQASLASEAVRRCASSGVAPA